MKKQPQIRAVIVEDEPLARRTIRDFVADEDWLEIVGEAADGHSAVHLIDELRPDLVFLDVKMPGLTGLQVLEAITHDPEVVFTTAYDDHAVTAFELEALDYVLKPFGRERFRKVLDRVQRRLIGQTGKTGSSVRERLGASGSGPGAEASSPNDPTGVRLDDYLLRLFVRDAHSRIVNVPVAEITRLVGADDYVEVYAKGASYLVNVTLSEFGNRLDPKHFRRIHRSAIINLDHLVSCTQVDRRLLLKLSDGSELIASRSGSQSLRDLSV
jgi:two-component system LytT family response regulator